MRVLAIRAGALGDTIVTIPALVALRRVSSRVELVGTAPYIDLAPVDQAYFRQSREARFGRTLEEVVEAGRERIKSLSERLDPMRVVLKRQPFLGGAGPLFCDYIVFGAFQWARTTSPTRGESASRRPRSSSFSSRLLEPKAPAEKMTWPAVKVRWRLRTQAPGRSTSMR